MAKSRVMSRQDFITGVEKLLGRFDADSFMRGFRDGFDRALDVVVEWTETPDLTFEAGKIAEQIRKQVKIIRRRRR